MFGKDLELCIKREPKKTLVIKKGIRLSFFLSFVGNAYRNKNSMINEN